MGTSPTDPPARSSKSPKQVNKSASKDPVVDKPVENGTKTEPPNAEATKPLAPPPRPQPAGANTPDYFSAQIAGSLSLEPNPFEQSFGGAPPETPGGTKLPSVAALTSPSSLLPGGGATPFNWGGGSLRTGPLSPAMLSGPQDYFSDTHHLRGGFPTPNESSLRTGLTPGGSGSMFPAPSPNSQALFAQLAGGGATPSTIDFHRTALSAAAKREQQAAVQQSLGATSQASEPNNTALKTEPKGAPGPFDPHDNDAANGLFMLAQGGKGPQPANSFATTTQPPGHSHPAPVVTEGINTSPQMASVNGNGSMGSGRGMSEGSGVTDESEQAKPNSRAKGKKGAAATNGTRRKAEDQPGKATANKKVKTNGNAVNSSMMNGHMDDDDNSDDDLHEKQDEMGGKSKMTDEEKRKNFLERNRVAALKCRQRKKQWLANLQNKVEVFTAENDALTSQIAALREEVVNLKTLLLAHKDCPVTQQQGLHSAYLQQAVMEPFNVNPYGMAVPNQPVMAGQPVQRRFS